MEEVKIDPNRECELALRKQKTLISALRNSSFVAFFLYLRILIYFFGLDLKKVANLNHWKLIMFFVIFSIFILWYFDKLILELQMKKTECRFEKHEADVTVVEENQCPICLQKWVHPSKLPCGHIFCFLCVKVNFILATFFPTHFGHLINFHLISLLTITTKRACKINDVPCVEPNFQPKFLNVQNFYIQSKHQYRRVTTH